MYSSFVASDCLFWLIESSVVMYQCINLDNLFSKVRLYWSAKVALCLLWIGQGLQMCPAQNNSSNLNMQLKSGDNLILATGCEDRRSDNPPKLTVFISLSEICMISQYYSRVLDEMEQNLKPERVVFKGVFPNPFSTDSTIADFRKERDLHFSLYRDPNGLFCSSNFMEVTPEVLVTDSLSNVVYRGRIDDFFFAIGRFRSQTNHHDLQNAIDQHLIGKKVSPFRVQPVGCLIDRRLWKIK